MPVLDEYRLDGKVAVVAGDSPSLTPHLAKALAEAGAKICLFTKNQSLIDEVTDKVHQGDEEAFGQSCDCASESAVEAAVETLLARWGRVDILVNCFQTEFAKPFDQVSSDEFQAVMSRNVKTVFTTCRVAGSRMVQASNGRIVNIISGLAERGLWNSAVYCASQGAVLQLTRALALEWARHNVRVNAIGTGWFSTEELPLEEAQKELLVRYIPLRRKGYPRDIGPLLVFLASDACDYTTGQPIYVDGGLMAHP